MWQVLLCKACPWVGSGWVAVLLPRKRNPEMLGTRASAALQLLSAYVRSRDSGSRRAPREPEGSVALELHNNRSHGLYFLCFLLRILCFLHGEASISSSLFSLMWCKKLRVLIPLQGFGWRAFQPHFLIYMFRDLHMSYCDYGFYTIWTCLL